MALQFNQDRDIYVIVIQPAKQHHNLIDYQPKKKKNHNLIKSSSLTGRSQILLLSIMIFFLKMITPFF